MSHLKQLDYRNYTLAIISGAMLTAAFPRTGFDFIAWFSFVPLLLAINSTRSVFKTGCLAGFVHHLTLVYWLVKALNEYGHLPIITCIPLLVLLCLYLSLYMGLFCVLVKHLCKKPWQLICAPFFWVALEYARTLTQFAFPWELLGYSQYLKLPLIQIADITGVYGISWLIILFNVAILCFLLNTSKQKWQESEISIRLVYAFLGCVILFFVLFLTYGLSRMYTIDQHIGNDAKQMKVAVVQGNIDQAVKWDDSFRKSTVDKYIQTSMSETNYDADLIVWPETAVPIYIQQETKLSQLLKNYIDNQLSAFLIGGLRYEKTVMGDWQFYNSAYLLYPGHFGQQYYDKAHLVPYGEYVPFQTVFPFLNKIVQGAGDFTEGQSVAPLKWNQWAIGPQICYEILFPSISRTLVQKGADIIVNITNDAWYGRSCAPYQHFSMVVFRAVENKRSLARAANTGISGCINPFGKIVSRSELFTKSNINCVLPVLDEITVYCQYGDIFAIFCCIVLIVALLLPFRKYFKKNQ
ncbi:MAG: apolipoprotein N-acyltransferase [Candidatus Magnetoglobus multicellularis str. Araruama]|uniref:Apolipoprotein N-acyltransferase n=1 Tax=Candidatus Magnetoglobus multicellularis str. Araruama TaxID=890399 RepID=A0A1V1P2Q8_9BACT|nr:MAG: apolipoprotein N-acyltransferase [Candidatus Magnetoglobus multicellularis str. Araruama]